MLGIKVTTNVGGYGVVGVLANGPGKVLLLRSDMDALPVAEQTGLPYASKVRTTDPHGATVGVMHACGHDVHMTNLVGVARYLASHRDKWSGTIVFMFQPAEETERRRRGDAQRRALLPRFRGPTSPSHCTIRPTCATGKISYRPGFTLANVDSVDIIVKGRGGHGASPESTIDPIVIAAKLVVDLQTIVSREVKPIDPAVVTVGSIHGGTKHNIISDECRLQLTLRSLSPEVRQQLRDAVRRKAMAAAASAGRAGADDRDHRRHAGAVQRSETDASRSPTILKEQVRRRQCRARRAGDGRRGFRPARRRRACRFACCGWAP